MTKTIKQSKFSRSLCAIAVSVVLGSVSHIAVAADSASSGYVSGSARTATGESLAGATIVIKNQDTGLERRITTNANGTYRFPLLPTGNYMVTAEKDGYLMAKLENVKVNMGNNTQLDLALNAVGSSDVERINVVGNRIATIDVSSSEAVMVVDQAMISRIPISRDITSIALMAPGTTQGDRGFGNFASFGGASVGENAYYLNGMNITNFRNGLGGADVPFELYDSFEVKTGGYSAEFGRSTGGVVNATTKRGTNDFKAGASVFFEPDSLRGTAKDSLRTDAAAIAEAGSKFYEVNSQDKDDLTNINVWASGAAIEDRLFYFVLLNQKERTADYATQSSFFYRDSSDLFAAGKFDFYINENNILEFTAFDSSSDLDTSRYNYNVDEDQLKSYRGDYILKRGGKTWALKYTSVLTDDFTMAVNYGVNKANYSNVNVGASPFGDTPMIFERFTGTNLGSWGLATPSVQEDERKALRIDFDYYLGDHTLRFGIDREEMSAIENTQRAGGVSYRYQGCDAAALEQEKAVGCNIVRKEIYTNSGDFSTDSNAYYITDTWRVTDQLTLNLGVRNEAFVNYNKAGIAFVDVDNQLAPRLGLVFDPTGSGDSKIFANYGRYYLPVATNTNIRLAGDELYTRQNFRVTAIDPTTFIPTLGDATSTLQVFADGTLKNTKETVNANIDPMYQDEFILGYHGMIDSDWSFGVKGTYRDLKSTLEDVAIDKGFNDMLVRDFGAECTLCDGFHYYVLTNPGKPVTITTDPDGSGPLKNQAYTISAEDLGYPEATRKYAAIDFNINRRWDEIWMLDATYTWSHNWGNSEGFVRSDNEQDDAGLTTNFDQPGLTDGAYGNLPNDRRHQVKVFGSYRIMEDLTAGVNFRWKSGRPKNAFGYHATDVFASYYGAESFYKDGKLVPRGSLGTTPSNYSIDLSLQYMSDFMGAEVTWRADVFNLLNTRKVLEVNEIAERYSSSDAVTGIDIGEADPDYGLPSDFENPRYMRLSVSVAF